MPKKKQVKQLKQLPKMSKDKNPAVHEPVLLEESTRGLEVQKKVHLKKQVRIIDATVGTGGHSLAILESGAWLLGIDADERLLEIAKERLEKSCPAPRDSFRGHFKLTHGNFKDIDKISISNHFIDVDGILFDLGVSSLHFESKLRGFSFQNPKALLDMRLDPNVQKVSAADLLNSLRKDQLTGLFSKTMDKKEVVRLVIHIIRYRRENKFKTVEDLLSIIEKAVVKKRKIHPATKAFLALRMAVNSELENLSDALPKAFEILGNTGRLVVISFHSGEDRIVKDYFRELILDHKARLITQKPIIPKESEIRKNPKARSAKMRIIEKI